MTTQRDVAGTSPTAAKIPCPLCGAQESNDIGTRNGFMLSYCATCSFVFMSQDFNYADFYNDFYYENYHNANALFDETKVVKEGGHSYTESERLHRKAYTDALSAIARFGTLQGKTYLDIGCAEGVGLGIAEEQGMNVAGIDVSDHSIEVCHKKGFLKTYVAELTEVTEVKNIDVVTMLDVLEHIKAPRPNIEALQKMVALGGLVYVNNNFFSLASFQHDPLYFKVRFEPPFHCSYFTEKQAIQLFEEYGFTLVYKRPQWVTGIFLTYSFLKRLINKDFRAMKKRITEERVPNPYKEENQSRSKIGRLLQTAYPVGLVFKRTR